MNININYKSKYFLISVITIIVFMFSSLFNFYSKKYIDNSLKQAAITYAITRSINAAVSIIQNSSISAGVGVVEGNFAIGEALDPINDATERFSDLLTLSIWTLSAEELIFELSNFKLFIAIVILLAVLNIFLKSKFLNKFLFLMIVLKLFIPFSTLISYYSDRYLFTPKITMIEKRLKPLVKKIQIKKHEKETFLTKIKNTLTDSSQKITQIKEYSKFYIRHAGEIISSIINLGAVYLSKLILNILILPLIFIYIFKNIKLE